MNPTAVDPKTTTRASAYELWMNVPNPMVYLFQNAGCHQSAAAQPEKRYEIQYAALLVHW